MSDMSTLRFFSTPAHHCSYLEDRQATTLFLDPHMEIDQELYTLLSWHGFRRSGNYLYRPHCANCQQCIPARIPVNQFSQKRRFRRIWKKNQDLAVRPLPAEFRSHIYRLYSRYINYKHADGDMFPPSEEQFINFLISSWGDTRFYGFYLEETLVCVAVVDQLLHGLSAVYTFYEPDLPERSLGTFSILWQIEQARTLRLPYLYLGYWVPDCQKMAYKGDFQPLEILRDHEWKPGETDYR